MENRDTEGSTLVRLICLDFDGTAVVEEGADAFLAPPMIECLNALRRRGIEWCSNSGRDFDNQLQVLQASRDRGLQHEPLALICSESMVYVRAPSGFGALEPWNTNAIDSLMRLHRSVQTRIDPHLIALSRRYPMRGLFIGEHFTAFHIEDRDEMPIRLSEEVEALLSDIPDAMLTRNGGWVAILQKDLGKGNALQAFADAVGLLPDHILAVGDHFNDMSMLDGRVARMTGCPANSIPAVQEAVRRANGFVSSRPLADGTIDVIAYYLDA